MKTKMMKRSIGENKMIFHLKKLMTRRVLVKELPSTRWIGTLLQLLIFLHFSEVFAKVIKLCTKLKFIQVYSELNKCKKIQFMVLLKKFLDRKKSSRKNKNRNLRPSTYKRNNQNTEAQVVINLILLLLHLIQMIWNLCKMKKMKWPKLIIKQNLENTNFKR